MKRTASEIEINQKLRLHIEQEFERRCRNNPRYSLRAFARSLGADSSYLSKLLNNKRTLSTKAIYNFASKLNFPAELGLNTSKQKLAKSRFTAVNIDEFKLISDWYHFAILELTSTDDFCPEVQWIAQTLEVSYGEIYAAVERLKRLGLLSVKEDGSWVCTKSNSTTSYRDSYTAFRHLQKQILEQAQTALEEVSIENRDQSSITMAVDKSRLSEAKKKIKLFRRELMEFLEGGKSKDAVFQLSISLFPVSHRKKEGAVHEQ